MKNEIEYLEKILEATLDRIDALTTTIGPQSNTAHGWSVIAEKDGCKVMKDNKSGLIWSDRVTHTMAHTEACKMYFLDDKAFCGLNLKWRLPTKGEFEEAERNDIRSALPNMDYWFWSSSVQAINPYVAWLFSGQDGGVYVDYFRDSSYASVRMVAMI
jgi:hypothetical protein